MIRKQRGKPSEDLRYDCIARGLRAAAFRRRDHYEHKKYRGRCARVACRAWVWA